MCGNNFDLYDVTADAGEVFFGDAKAEITETQATFVTVVVPNGVSNKSQIKVVSKKSTVIAPVLYRDDTNLLKVLKVDLVGLERTTWLQMEVVKAILHLAMVSIFI